MLAKPPLNPFSPSVLSWAMQSFLYFSLRDGFTWWRALGWPLVWMPVLVWLTATTLDTQLQSGFNAEPLRLAVFTETPAPELLAWLEEAPNVALRTDVEPMRFRALVAADSLDAAWIAEEGYAEAIAEGRAGSLQQFSNVQSMRTEARLDRLLAKYKNQLLEVRLQSAGLDGQLAYPLDVRTTDVGRGLDAVADLVRGIVLVLSVFFALAAAFYVLAYGNQRASARQALSVATGWGLLAALATILGLFIGLALVGSKATVLTNVVDDLWQPSVLAKWALLSLLGLLAGVGIGALATRPARSYRGQRGVLRAVQVILLGGVIWGMTTGGSAWPLLGWVSAGIDWVGGAEGSRMAYFYLLHTLILAVVGWLIALKTERLTTH